jgi:hypothetical protein
MKKLNHPEEPDVHKLLKLTKLDREAEEARIK